MGLILIPCTHDSRGQGAVIAVCVWSLTTTVKAALVGHCRSQSVVLSSPFTRMEPESSGSKNGAGKPSGKKRWRLEVDKRGIMNLGYKGEKVEQRGNAE